LPLILDVIAGSDDACGTPRKLPTASLTVLSHGAGCGRASRAASDSIRPKDLA